MRTGWPRFGVAAVVFAIGAYGRDARAGEDDMPAPTGLELGLRTGFGKGFGDDLEDDAGSEDDPTGQIPIWVDLGYRIIPHLYVGGFFQYGIMLLNNAECDREGVSCHAYDMRFGLQGQFHILPAKIFDPWVGLGVGYEIFGLSASDERISASFKTSGFQFLHLALGGDYRPVDNFGIGPFVDFSIGQFTNTTIEAPPPLGNSSGSIQDPTLHYWLTFGLRGTFTIPVGEQVKSEHKQAPKAAESKTDVPDTAEPPAPPPNPGQPSPPPPPPQKGVSAGESGAWPASVPTSDRGTCSLVCVAKDGPPPRESDKAALSKALDKHLGAVRACVGGGKSAGGVVVSFDTRGNGIVNYDFGPRAVVRSDCPGSFPPVKNVSGPPNTTWKCTDYCE